jgi:hypothetical protein
MDNVACVRVSTVEQNEGRQIMTVKVNYANGDYEYTRINATPAEVQAYYIGKTFNIGSVSDNLQKCTSIEIMED